MKEKEARTGFILSAIVMAFGLYGQMYIKNHIPEDGQAYGKVVFWMMFVLGICLVIETINNYRKAKKAEATLGNIPKSEDKPEEKEKFDWFGPVGIILMAILFVILIQKADDLINLVLIPVFGYKIKSGMFVAIPLFMVAGMRYFKISWKKTAIITAVATGVIYLMFVVLLKIYMP